MFAKYIEIYTTLDMEKYFRVKNLLAENNISYKDTSTNNQLRLSLNNLRGDNPVLLRDSSIKNTYYSIHLVIIVYSYLLFCYTPFKKQFWRIRNATLSCYTY